MRTFTQPTNFKVYKSFLLINPKAPYELNLMKKLKLKDINKNCIRPRTFNENFTYTNCADGRSSWEAASFSADQEIPCFLWNKFQYHVRGNLPTGIHHLPENQTTLLYTIILRTNLKILFNRCFDFSRSPFLSDLRINFCTHFLTLQFYTSSPYHPRWFDLLIMSCEGYTLWRSTYPIFSCNLLPSITWKYTAYHPILFVIINQEFHPFRTLFNNS